MSDNSQLFKFDNPNINLFFTAEKISRDYLEFLKLSILPTIAKRYDVRLREFLAFICIGSALRPVSSSELATYMRQDPATMTRSNVVLIGKGYIRTSKSFGDSRVKILNITEKGQEFLDFYKQLVDTKLEKIGTHYRSDGSNEDLLETASQTMQPFQRHAEQLADLSYL